MSEKLMPCPFCGGEAIMGIACHVHEDYAFRVECRECKIVTPFYDTEAEAITTWNRAMGATDIHVGDKERTAKVEVHSHPCGVSGKCYACGGDVYNDDPYCSHCGARLDWSE